MKTKQNNCLLKSDTDEAVKLIELLQCFEKSINEIVFSNNECLNTIQIIENNRILTFEM